MGDTVECLGKFEEYSIRDKTSVICISVSVSRENSVCDARAFRSKTVQRTHNNVIFV